MLLYCYSPKASAFTISNWDQYPRPGSSDVSLPPGSNFWNGHPNSLNVGATSWVTNSDDSICKQRLNNTSCPPWLWDQNGQLSVSQNDIGQNSPSGPNSPNCWIVTGFTSVPHFDTKTPVTSVGPYNSCWVVHRQIGFPAQYSNYEVVVPSQMLIPNNSITVTVVNACRDPKDANGWEDHSFQSPTAGGVEGIEVYSGYHSSNQQWSGGFSSPTTPLPNDCNSYDNLDLTLTSADFKPAADLPGMQRAKVVVKNQSPGQSEKMFSVKVITPSTGVFIGPDPTVTSTDTTGGFVNLKNPGASYYFTPYKTDPSNSAQISCLPLGGKSPPRVNSDCPSAWDGGLPGGGYFSMNVPYDSDQPQTSVYDSSNCYGSCNNNQNDNGQDYNQFNFYFSPDCTITGNNQFSQPLIWRDGQGTNETQNRGEGWRLFDLSSKNPTAPFDYATYDQLGEDQAGVGNESKSVTLTPGHVYQWQWYGVDRAHGISVKLPFSEYTATGSFTHNSCPTSPQPTGSDNPTCENITLYFPTPGTAVTTGGQTYKVGPQVRYAIWVNGASHTPTPSTNYTANTIYNDNTDYPPGAGNGSNHPVVSDVLSPYSSGGQTSYTYDLIAPPAPISGPLIVSGMLTYSVIMYQRISTTQFIVWYSNINATYGPCNQAHCSISIDSNGPDSSWQNGNLADEEAGNPFNVNVTIYNDGVNWIAPIGFGNQLSATWNMDGGSVQPSTPNPPWAPPGGSTTSTITITAPNDRGPHTINAYPDYWGWGAIGTWCGPATFNDFQQFGSNPMASAKLVPTNENPNQVQKTYSVNPTGVSPPPQAVNEQLTYNGLSVEMETAPGSYTFGPIRPGGGGANTPAPGDTYCATITVSPGSGWLGPGGAIRDSATTSDGPHCDTLVNEPYFRVKDSGVTACSGEVVSWNDDTGTNPTADSNSGYGAGSQLAAIALAQIAGFASGQNSASFSGVGPTQGTGLTFANTVGVSGNVPSQDTPLMGGQYGSSPCLTRLSASGSTTPLPANFKKADIQSNPNTKINYVASGPVTIDPPGNTPLCIPNGKSVAVYVPGDVYIKSNIEYNGGGTDCSPTTWSSQADIPSFTLVATGNIYINKDVTELDGYYQAQSASSKISKIYTCATAMHVLCGTGGGNLYSQGNKQLLVVGSFVAPQINLMRTLGSLRDEVPTVRPSVAKPLYRFKSPGGYLLQLNNSSPPSGYGNAVTQGYAYQPYLTSPVPFFPLSQPWNYCPSENGMQTVPLIGDVHYGADIRYNTWAGSGGASGEIGNGSYSNPVIVACVFPGGSTPPAGTTGLARIFSNNANGFYGHYVGVGPISDGYTNCPGTPSPPPGQYYCEFTPSNPVAFLLSSSGATVVPPPAILPGCSNPGSWSAPETCAAEFFNFSPEMYLSSQPPNNANTSMYQAFTSLPPVL